jgi:L-alanine-DL-glutamate epimerase-like enolase superfamily enzyme
MLPAPQLACGLATGPLLAGDVLAQPITVHNGMIWLPDQPGLGVRLAEHQLARYAGAWRY